MHMNYFHVVRVTWRHLSRVLPASHHIPQMPGLAYHNITTTDVDDKDYNNNKYNSNNHNDNCSVSSC
jgi:hypothetical protein